jgi:hypothetical protein
MDLVEAHGRFAAGRRKEDSQDQESRSRDEYDEQELKIKTHVQNYWPPL